MGWIVFALIGTVAVSFGLGVLIGRRRRPSSEDDIPAVSVERMDGVILLTCRACAKRNRVQLARCLDRPVCGYCKVQLMPRDNDIAIRTTQYRHNKLVLEAARCRDYTRTWQLLDRAARDYCVEHASASRLTHSGQTGN